jgi:hypothetical protein
MRGGYPSKLIECVGRYASKGCALLYAKSHGLYPVGLHFFNLPYLKKVVEWSRSLYDEGITN